MNNHSIECVIKAADSLKFALADLDSAEGKSPEERTRIRSFRARIRQVLDGLNSRQSLRLWADELMAVPIAKEGR